MPLVVHIDDNADIILRGDEDVDVAIVSIYAKGNNWKNNAYDVFWECHTPSMLKISFVNFDKGCTW